MIYYLNELSQAQSSEYQVGFNINKEGGELTRLSSFHAVGISFGLVRLLEEKQYLENKKIFLLLLALFQKL